MEEKKETNNQESLNNDLTQDDILRCPNCNLICFLYLKYKKEQPIIEFKCENGHNGDILLINYMKDYNKFSLSQEKCKECGKNQNEIKVDYVYCYNCCKFICNLCILNHLTKNKHKIIDFQKFDSLCKLHFNTFSWFCDDCQKNICCYCKPTHKNHNLVDLIEIDFTEELKKKLKEEMKDLEFKIQNLDDKKQKIISMIDKNKETIKMEMNFLKMLFNTYLYEEKQKNLNYYVIQNLKKNSSDLIKNYGKLYDEGNKFIILLQNIRNSNNIKNFFKCINNHSDTINYLGKLKDGRLVSCSDDYTLKIFKKNTFEIQLSIKEHSKRVNSFTQINDGRIISCSGDETMKIIKLIKDDIYEIHQTLIGHTNDVFKIIEIRKNELISISRDKTMKIWILNNENKFECITTLVFENKVSNGNILKLNEKEFVTSSCLDESLTFWNSYNYQNITTLNNISTPWSLKTLCLLEKDILCVGGRNSKGFYIIKISTHQVIKTINGSITTIWTVEKCMDDLILCSIDHDGKHNLVKYKFKDGNFNEITEKVKAHNKNIHSCVEINEEFVASGGEDKLIKLWKS